MPPDPRAQPAQGLGQLALGGGGGVQPQSPPQTPEEFQQRKAGFMEFFQRPEVIAGLLQFAGTVTQPRGFGQTVGGKIGEAGLAGLAAGGRVVEGRKVEAETARKAGLEERRVAATEAQAAATTQRAELAGESLELERDKFAEEKRQFGEVREATAQGLAQRLASQRNIALTKGRLSVLAELIKAEMERASEAKLFGEGDPTPNIDRKGGVLEHYRLLEQAVQSLRSGGTQTAAAPTTPEDRAALAATLTEQEWDEILAQPAAEQVAREQLGDEIVDQEKAKRGRPRAPVQPSTPPAFKPGPPLGPGLPPNPLSGGS